MCVITNYYYKKSEIQRKSIYNADYNYSAIDKIQNHTKKQLQERFSKKWREFQMKTITYIEPSSGPSFNISLVLFATIDFTSFIGGKVNTRDLTLESFPLTSPVEAFPLLLLQHF